MIPSSNVAISKPHRYNTLYAMLGSIVALLIISTLLLLLIGVTANAIYRW